MPVHVSLGFRKEGQLECSDGIPCCICTLGVCRLLRFDVRRGDCRVPPPSPPHHRRPALRLLASLRARSAWHSC